MNRERLLIAGRIVGAFGVKGWVRVQPLTESRDALLGYTPWWVNLDRPAQDPRPVEIDAGQSHGRGLVVKFKGIDDRNLASSLMGREIYLQREQLPSLDAGEFYWSDLIGLSVRGRDGRPLGRVTGLIETGANDILIVEGEREHLIPFLLQDAVPNGVIETISLDDKEIVVDWDDEP